MINKQKLAYSGAKKDTTMPVHKHKLIVKYVK